MRCETENKFLSSTKRDPAFIINDFTTWKYGPRASKKHQISDCHREAIETFVILPQCTRDVGELLSTKHEAEKPTNEKCYC